MDANVIMTMISTIGFPICACVFLGVYSQKMQENYRADIKELQMNQNKETDKMTEAINNNSELLRRLLDRFDRLEGTSNDK